MEYSDYNDQHDGQPTTRGGKIFQMVFLIVFVAAFAALLIWVYFGAPENTRSHFPQVSGQSHSFGEVQGGENEVSVLQKALAAAENGELYFNPDFRAAYPIVSQILNGEQEVPEDRPFVLDQGNCFALIRQAKNSTQETANLDVFLLRYESSAADSKLTVTAHAPERFTLSFRMDTRALRLEEADASTFMALPYSVALAFDVGSGTLEEAEYELRLNAPVEKLLADQKFFENHVYLTHDQSQRATPQAGGEGSRRVAGYFGARFFKQETAQGEKKLSQCDVALRLDDNMLKRLETFSVTVTFAGDVSNAGFAIRAN